MPFSRVSFNGKSQSPYHGKTVLVVDDSDISRLMLKAMIEAICGSLVVHEARDGDEAIKMVEKFKPDLITLDEEMPNKNGLDTVPELQKINPGGRIVLITAHKEENVKAKVKELAIEYVAKPITEAKVINLLS
ncbi:response regulator transcription factor [Litoribrevibacter albus]|uniref:Response regulator n=1 Tax=Litoribrevibacter albus TaxID=1473156 RepID=A0AA37SEJ0_9GAMM|nr:response regulator [Litoribrevibacter albus]GLQ33653.1 response regulator [Litoribrevibacter albus]